MSDRQHLIQKLQSTNLIERYDACEELRVSQQPLPQDVINALNSVIHDSNPDIADAAKRVLEYRQSQANLDVTPDKEIRDDPTTTTVATSKWLEILIGFFGWAIFHNIYFLIGSGLGIFSIDSIVVVLIFAVSPFLIGSWFLISKKNLWRGIGCVMAILTSALIFRFSYGHPILLTIFLPYPGGVYFLMDAFIF